jgi:hypothetical protein
MGRKAIGVEIDPVSRLIAKVKATPLLVSDVDAAHRDIVRYIPTELKKLRGRGGVSQLPQFRNRSYWFSLRVSRCLMAVSRAILDIEMPTDVRDFFWVALSSVILARGSVANARDIIHSRHHYFEHQTPPDVLERFDRRVKLMRGQVQQFADLCALRPSGGASIIGGDARRIALADESIDLIFTSPPYATALDYPRAHFLSVPWLAPVLGTDVETYLHGGMRYIGAERGKKQPAEDVLQSLKELEQTYAVIKNLNEAARPQVPIIGKYFLDMQRVLQESRRLLKAGCHLVLVVCPSHIRKVQIPTNRLLAEIGEKVGLKLKAEHVRTISERRRVLPYVDGDLRKRMDTEYVMIFQRM